MKENPIVSNGKSQSNERQEIVSYVIRRTPNRLNMKINNTTKKKSYARNEKQQARAHAAN